MSGWRFRLEPIRDLDAAMARWRALEREISPLHPFLTAAFVETWLAAIPPLERPDLILGEGDGGAACLSLLSQPSRRGRPGLRRTVRMLGLSGHASYDSFFLEHYRPVVSGAALEGASAALVRWLDASVAPDHDLLVPGADNMLCGAIAGALQDRATEIERRPAFLIDLTAAGSEIDGRPFWGGASGRRAVRAALRAVGAEELRLEVARDPAEAALFLGELIELHQARWTRRGQSGAFAELWMRRFADDLSRRSEISRLLRLRYAGRTRAVLFNLRSGDYEANLQSGVAPPVSENDRPGYLAHLLAAEMAGDEGVRIYDFMAGENQLKRGLSNHRYMLNWIDFRIADAAHRVERALGGVKRLLTEKSG